MELVYTAKKTENPFCEGDLAFFYFFRDKLTLAANPLVFVKTRSSDRFLSQSFTLSTNGLEEVSECLWDMAKEIDEKYEAYWEKKKD